MIQGIVLLSPPRAFVVPANISEIASPIVEQAFQEKENMESTSSEKITITEKEETSSVIIPEEIPEKKKDTEEAAVLPETIPLSEKISFSGAQGLQGEAVKITLKGADDIKDIQSITFEKENLPIFAYKGEVQTIYGIDINHPVGQFRISAKLKDGSDIFGLLTVKERVKPVEDFTIPESLGGTTPEGEKTVVSLLSKENAVLANLWSNPRHLWTHPFMKPVKNPVITDTYGYSRDTGSQLITHKGADFRATPGTSVYAINRGVVRLVDNFSIYGKTVIIDHGQGILSFYMHLSKISVTQGTVIERGEQLGESGATGYAEGPHLHLTIRVNNTSIDPIAFFELYGS